MFVKADDVYFIAYNLLISLYELKATSTSRPFRDYRKLSFLIDFVADPRLTAILQDSKRFGIPPNSEDRHELSVAYSRGASRMPHSMRVICALESRGILSIERGNQSEGFDLWLHVEKLPGGFLADELYEVERSNISTLRAMWPQLRIVRLDTMLQNFFGVNGVEAWHA